MPGRFLLRPVRAIQTWVAMTGIRLVARYVLRLRIEVTGQAQVPHGEALIVAGGPHRNWIDGFLMLYVMPNLPRMVFLGSENAQRIWWRRLVLRRAHERSVQSAERESQLLLVGIDDVATEQLPDLGHGRSQGCGDLPKVRTIAVRELVVFIQPIAIDCWGEQRERVADVVVWRRAVEPTTDGDSEHVQTNFRQDTARTNWSFPRAGELD